ncbi:uncharacterized protein FOMMEDRAFT_139387 [Fomitiporia mediterranea MF3/22]|uniref:uncharacterized protein n=1 Tax=Fomitiporia mediterranea (strain MF3/22) TaxID=694068 RepID=UPI00044090E8|nr:uncharacterized protein FOMMEDRAFT_139387 [Fomitiporia mediterranea MF3/22]EJD06135.1 hypothetical protein FOMMEDRAFT_139387 [Fomitiporia mediterranea MF3/22]
MSRRDSSRVHIAVRQNDTLAEFENFKKKFLFANKQITKQNCSLSMKIEELNAHISTLYVENLRLRASEIALQSQLKREKVKSHKIMADAEAAAFNLLKHFGFIRESYNVPLERPHSPKDNGDSSPPSRCQKPPPRSPSAPRLAQLPTVPDIYEEPEPHEGETSSEENDHGRNIRSDRQATLTSSRRRESISRLPVPSRVSTPPPVSAMSSPMEEGPTTSRKRKLTRRASGLMPSIEPTPRPVSPVLGSPMQQDIELSAEEEAAALQDVEAIAAREEEQDHDHELPSKKPRKKSKTRDESDRDMTERRERRKAKEKENRDAASSVRLKDVTNSPRRRRTTSTGTTSASETDHVKHGKELPNSARPALAISPPLKLSSEGDIAYLPTPAPSSAGNTPVAQHFSLPHPPPSSNDTADVGTSGAGRERRTRKSVNYAEPKLNTKMRKPDSIPPPGARPSLSTSTVPLSATQSTMPNQNQNNLIRGPSLPEYEESDGHGMTQSALPPSRPTSSSSTSSSSATAAKSMTAARRSTASSSSTSTSSKRKRSARSLSSLSDDGGLVLDDDDVRFVNGTGEEEDDSDGGGEADSEFSEFRAWANVNINSRRKSTSVQSSGGRGNSNSDGGNSMVLDVEEGFARRRSVAV